jgi:predicted transcriptional regulator
VSKGQSSAKKEALALIRRISPSASWDDIMHELYSRKKITEGIAAADAGRVISHDDVKRRFLGKR